MATLLGIEAPDKAESQRCEFGHVEVIVDDNYSAPSQDESTSTQPRPQAFPTVTAISQSSTETTEPTPDQGEPIDGGGVPCVN